MSRIPRWVNINPSREHKVMWNHAAHSAKTGNSLAGHAKSAHGGEVDANCPACIELQARIKKEM